MEGALELAVVIGSVGLALLFWCLTVRCGFMGRDWSLDDVSPVTAIPVVLVVIGLVASELREYDEEYIPSSLGTMPGSSVAPV